MHRLGGSGQTQDALHRREDGVAAAERLLWGEGNRPGGQAAHSGAPAKPLQAAPSLVCGKLNPVNSSGEEPGLRSTGPGHRLLEGTEQATVRCWGWGSGSSRSYSKRQPVLTGEPPSHTDPGTRGPAHVGEAGQLAAELSKAQSHTNNLAGKISELLGQSTLSRDVFSNLYGDGELCNRAGKNTQAARKKEARSRSRQEAEEVKLQQPRVTFSPNRTRKPGRCGTAQGWHGSSHTEKIEHPRRASCPPRCQPQSPWAGTAPAWLLLHGPISFFCFIHLSMYNSGKIINTAFLNYILLSYFLLTTRKKSSHTQLC